MVRKKYKTLYLPEGGSIKKRKRTKRSRRRHRRLCGKGVIGDYINFMAVKYNLILLSVT